MLFAEIGQAGQLLRARFAAGKDRLDAALRQAEIAAQIGEGGVAGDELPVRDGLEFFLIFRQHLLELFVVGGGVFAVKISVGRVRFGQGGGNVLNFCLGGLQAEPAVGIVAAVFVYVVLVCIGDYLDALRSVDGDEVFIVYDFQRFIRPRFMPRPLYTNKRAWLNSLRFFVVG